MATSKNIEELIDELEEIVTKMDDEEITLEQSFQLYTKGMKLCKQCNDKIDKVEKQLEIMTES